MFFVRKVSMEKGDGDHYGGGPQGCQPASRQVRICTGASAHIPVAEEDVICYIYWHSTGESANRPISKVNPCL
jgi:hypothetical protein